MRVLVLGAGGPAGVNVCKALQGHEVLAQDDNADHLVWCEPYAETHCFDLTVENVNELQADVVIPQPDRVTMWTADHADQIEAKTFLPDRRTIALCQDKFMAGLEWRRAGLREDRIELVDSPEAECSQTFPFWLRARYGAGAKAAILARSYIEAYHWIQFWHERAPQMDFVAEAYLPGRDLAWSGIYYQGELVCSFARERLEYLYPNLTPEGLTGTPTIAEIVHDDAVNVTAEEAVLAVDQKPHGIFSVDLKEDAAGMPRPTEINAGRGFTTFGLWAMEHHTTFFGILGCAMGAPFGWRNQRDIIPAGRRMYRHIDCGTHVTAQVPA